MSKLIGMAFSFFVAVLLFFSIGCSGNFKAVVQSSAIAPQDIKFSSAQYYLGVGQSKDMTPIQGDAPFSFEILSGQGEISSEGVLSSSIEGTIVLRVSSAKGISIQFAVVVNDKPIIHLPNSINGGSKIPVSIQGGRIPYQFEVVNCNGQIDNQGNFTAPTVAGTCSVKVADSNGLSTEKAVEITLPLSFLNSEYNLQDGSSQLIVAQGGVPPIRYFALGGGLSVNESTGVVTADKNSEGVTILMAKDSQGNTAFASVNVLNGASNAMLVVPSVASVGLGQTLQISIEKGKAPFTYQLEGVGTFDVAKKVYTAPLSLGAVTTAQIRVTDSSSTPVSATVQISVNSGLTLSGIANQVTALATATIVAEGGAGGPYSFLSQRGTINSSTGMYIAPSTAGLDVITVRDQLGNSISQTVQIVDRLRIVPSSLGVLPQTSLQIMTIGGVAPISISLLSGKGKLSADHILTVEEDATEIVVQAIDSNGDIALGTYTVVKDLAISVVQKKLTAGKSALVTISGGNKPYSLSLAGDSPAGSVELADENTLRYTAPSAIQESKLQEVIVRDANQQTVRLSVELIPAVKIKSNYLEIATTSSAFLTAEFGAPPYQFSLQNSNGTLKVISGGTVEYLPSSAGTQTIIVTDSELSTSSVEVSVVVLDKESPTVVLSSVTLNPTSSSQIAINVAFSEPVVDFTLSDVMVTNGSSGNLAGSGASYNFIVTPSAQGDVVISIPASVAVDLANNLSLASNTLTRTFDNIAPTSPGILINSNSQYTNLSLVTLGLNALGDATEQYVTETSGCGAGGSWEPYTVTKQWSLLGSDGPKNLYVKFRDLTGNESSCVGDDITLDTTAPSAPSGVADGTYSNSLTTSPVITFVAATDTGSGILRHEARVLKSSDLSEVKAWATFISGNSIASLPMTDNANYKVEVRAIDNAGNISAGALSDGWTANTCPVGYVEVPPLTGYTSRPFCVMKYEAKILGNDNGNQAYNASFVADSRPSGTPWVNMLREQSLAECRALGTGYDLISNLEWQTIARNVELTPSNWSGGVVGVGMLNRGHSDGAPALNLSVSDENDPYSGTGNSSSDAFGSGGEQKRTHTLSNGSVLWDLGGNIYEIMKETSGSLGVQNNASLVTNASDVIVRTIANIKGNAKFHFGTSGDYSSLGAGQYGGLGYIAINGAASEYQIGRGGGYWGAQTQAGVFYATGIDTFYTNDSMGFRCVYHPPTNMTGSTFTINGKGLQDVRDIETDTFGNTYVVGTYVNSTADDYIVKDFVGNVLLGLSGSIGTDSYLAKFDAAGNFLWIKTFGGNSSDMVTGVAPDTFGNIYVAGTFKNDLVDSELVKDFNGATLLGASSVSSYDAFVAKIDANGVQQWIKVLGGTGEEKGFSISVDTANNFPIVAGTFRNSNTNSNAVKQFDGVSTLNGHGATATLDIFVARLGTNGSISWLKTMGGNANEEIFELEVYDQYLVVAGSYLNDNANSNLVVDLAGNSLVGKTATSSSDGFVAKLLINGTHQWTKTIGGTGADSVVALAGDTKGNIYVGGKYSNSNANAAAVTDFLGNFVSGKGVASTVDIYIAKLNSSGTQEWIRTFGGEGAESMGGLALLSDEIAVVSGSISNSSSNANSVTDWSGNSLLGLASVATNDAFLATLGADGGQKSILVMGGASSDSITTLNATYSGKLFIVGYYGNDSANSKAVKDLLGNDLIGGDSVSSADGFFSVLTP